MPHSRTACTCREIAGFARLTLVLYMYTSAKDDAATLQTTYVPSMVYLAMMRASP